MSDRVRELRDQLLDEMADVMLLALRAQAGVLLQPREYERLHEKLVEALRGSVTI